MAQRTKEEAQEEQSLMQRLETMPKKTIHIPEDPNNPDDVVPIGWNGIIYAVPRGISFEVPEVIADIWQESYAKTMAANKKIKISENRDIVVYG